MCSGVRGNMDLIQDQKGGFFCNPDDANAFAKKINKLTQNCELREQMSRFNLEKIKQFDIVNVNKEMKSIYKEVLNN